MNYWIMGCISACCLCLSAPSLAREPMTTPTPQEMIEQGMKGSKIIDVPTPQGTMVEGMRTHPKRSVRVSNERDLVGMPLDNQRVWGESIGHNHILDMRNKMSPLRESRERETTVSE